jgi:hypothetical protein
MAVQNSAVGKLSHYIQNMFLRKARESFDEKIIQHLQETKNFLEEIESGLEGFEGTDDMDGWEASPEFVPSEQQAEDETLSFTDTEGNTHEISIHDVGRNFQSIVNALFPMMNAFESEGFTGGLADVFPNNETMGDTLNSLFTENGSLRPQFKLLWDAWKTHPTVQEYNEKVAKSSDKIDTNDENIEEDVEAKAIENFDALTPARKNLVNQLREKHFKDIDIKFLPPEELNNMVVYSNEAMKQRKAERDKFMDDYVPQTDPLVVGETPTTPPAEETPAGETPAEETPTEETPAGGPSTDDEGEGGTPAGTRDTISREDYTALYDAQPEDVLEELSKVVLPDSPTGKADVIGKARQHFGLPRRTAGRTNTNVWETPEYDGDDVDSAEYGGLNDKEKEAYNVWKPHNRQNFVEDDPEPEQVIIMARAWRQEVGLPTSTKYNYSHRHGTPEVPSAQVPPTSEESASTEEAPFDFDQFQGGRGEDIPPTFPPGEGGGFDFEQYREYIPRQIDGDNPPILLPKNEDGEDYNPLAKGEAMTTQDLIESIDTLKRLYIDLHKGNEENTKPHLGRGYFPTRDVDSANEHQVHFIKDEIQDEEIPKFNKLNENKAVLEEYLMLLTNMKTGEVQRGLIPGYGDAFWDTEVWDSPDDLEKYDAGNYIPRNGLYQWYQALESLGSKDNAGIYDKTGASTRDADGNLNFHMIPGENREPALGQNFTNFVGGLGKPFGLNYTQNVLKDIIGTNKLRFPGFTVEGRSNHFNQAWKTWAEENKAMNNPRDKNNQFINWLEDTDDDAKPRFQHVIDGTTFGTPPPSPEDPKVEDPKVEDPKVEDPKVEDPKVEDPGVVPEAGTPSHIDKDELVRRLMQQEDKHGFDSAEDRTWHEEDLRSKPHEALLQEYRNKVLGSRQKLREEGTTGRRKDEQAAAKTSTLGDKKRKELIKEYISAHRDMYNQPLDPRLIEVLQNKSDKDLQQMHEKLLQEFGNSQRQESSNLQTYHANNINFTIKSLAPLQEHLTKDDIMMQVRKLIHHQQAYGKFMDSDSKKVWGERMAEAHQLADAANMNLDLRLQEDIQEASDKGDFGSTNWLERVGEAHIETQTRRNAHRDVVSRGSELRTNVNYKPHIIASYDDNGNFQGFQDLKTGQGVDQFNLRFNDDDHYYFHGLDPEKVKDYKEYTALKRQAGEGTQPGDIPPVFGPPPAPTNPKLAELEGKIKGAEYKDIRDRFSAIGDLPGAQQIFNNKFTKDTYGRPGTPVNPDGSGTAVPRFYRGISDNVGEQGWYHPESESWINPHRYRELINHMGGQPNSGRVILHGRQFYGKGQEGESNPADPKYGFAIPTEAKQQQFRSGYDDQSYYVDDTGAIAHAHDSFEAGNIQSHDQPQNVNGVVHDWYAQQIGNQMKANPSAFVNEQGKVRQVAVIDTPPASPNQPPSVQNMWLELAAGESLGREPGSALERRDKKKQSGWEWFDKKLQQPKEVLSRIEHPWSSTARDPLSPQELGQQQWWSNASELKQKYFDAVDWPQLKLLSWAGKLLVGGEKPEDKIIRRIRQGYKHQAETEQLTREAANRITVNGQRLSETYVAPGEQKARNEDYQELKRYFTNQVNFNTNKRNEAGKKDKKNPQNVKDVHDHGTAVDKWVGLGNTLGQYDSKMPHHWKDINDMYTTHLGKVNQALPADASLDEWGTVMSQPSGNRWGATMRQPDGGKPTQTKWDIPPVFGRGDEGTQIPSVVGVSSQEPSQESSQESVKIPAVFGV